MPFRLSAYSITKLNKEFAIFSQLLYDNRKQVKTVTIRPYIWAEIILREQCKKSVEIEK